MYLELRRGSRRPSHLEGRSPRNSNAGRESPRPSNIVPADNQNYEDVISFLKAEREESRKEMKEIKEKLDSIYRVQF